MATTADGTGFGKNWDDKIRLLDAIDSMRAAPAAVAEKPAPAVASIVSALAPASAASVAASAGSSIDIIALQEKLRVYEQTCAMLEREVHELEQQTFASLAEAGRLRRELDRSKAERGAHPLADSAEYIEKAQFNRIVKESENERRLLIDALESSEAELARMVKTLDLVVRKLQVA